MSIDSYNILILILIYGIVTLGLDLVVGYAKVFSVTQALLFGVGAFGYAASVNMLHTESIFIAILIGAAAASIISAVVALASLRVSGDYFIVISLSAQIIGLQVIYNWNQLSNGASGVFGLPPPNVAGWTPATVPDYFWLVLITFLIVYVLVAILLLSPYGRVVRALGANESALAAAGFNARRLKLTMFVACGILAAIGGVLFGGYNGEAQTGDYSVELSMTLLAMVVIGGSGRMLGAVVGAALLELIPYELNKAGISSAISGPLNQAIFGAMLVLVVMFMPAGITGVTARGVGWVRQRWRGGDAIGASGGGLDGAESSRYVVDQSSQPVGATTAGGPSHGERRGVATMAAEPTFELHSVTKRFGKLTAVDNVSVALGEPGITGIVGPNGAGKTTLFNLITGQLKPTEGTVHFDGGDVTTKAPQDMARMGIGRSFQDIRLFDAMSVRDNVTVYAQDVVTGRISTTFLRPLKARNSQRTARARADEVLAYLGISELRGKTAETLSFAQQKLVAIARLLALEPRIVFLDEPASGLDERGREMLASVIRKLADDGLSICFVEHNTHLVRALSTRVLFVSEGQIMADGTPEEVFSNQHLAEVFLGLA